MQTLVCTYLQRFLNLSIHKSAETIFVKCASIEFIAHCVGGVGIFFKRKKRIIWEGGGLSSGPHWGFVHFVILQALRVGVPNTGIVVDSIPLRAPYC